jgi:hypothetical protein
MHRDAHGSAATITSGVTVTGTNVIFCSNSGRKLSDRLGPSNFNDTSSVTAYGASLGREILE